MAARGSIAAALFLVACSGGGGGSSAANPDGGTGPAGTVTIHTRAPVALIEGGGTNATWAAVRDASGQWKKLEAPATVGTYVIPATGPTWAIAFVCADGDRSTVAVYERLNTVSTLDVELVAECSTAEVSSFDMTGTFAHVPAATSWLDFGYALDDRGFTMPANGDSAPYELLSVIAGTWDLGFGLRSEGGAPLTKLMLVRDQSITAATKLDIDVAATGFDPITKALVVNGIGPEENFAVTARYALNGGLHGLDIGPQSVPFGQATATMTYLTVPPDRALPKDRHRIQALAADADKETRTATRSADASFTAPIDVTLDLPAALAVPRAERTTPTPYVRITAFVATRPNALAYQADIVGRVSNRVTHTWRLSLDGNAATGPEAILAMPDLTTAEGFDKAWAIGDAVSPIVTGTVYEAPAPLGDGTVIRSATHSFSMP